MAEIVNLRRQRKQRERAEAAQAAVENRARHGRTTAERANDARTRMEAAERLDALKLVEPPPSRS